MSNSAAHNRASKKRQYRLGKRAEAQGATRQRIVEAAVDLHSRIGPARTTVAGIAEQAGVQRNTFYAHFPDERSLLDACSGLTLERDPPPDPDIWRAIAPGPERVRPALEQLYGWYRRNAQLAGSVLRDAEVHEATRETVEAKWAPAFRKAAEVIADGLDERSHVLARVAVDFACWRALDAAAGPEAAAIMADAIVRAAPAKRG